MTRPQGSGMAMLFPEVEWYVHQSAIGAGCNRQGASPPAKYL